MILPEIKRKVSKCTLDVVRGRKYGASRKLTITERQHIELYEEHVN